MTTNMQHSKDEKVVVAADEIPARLPIAHDSRQSNNHQWSRRLIARDANDTQRPPTLRQVEAGNERDTMLPQYPAATVQRPTRLRDLLFELRLRSATNVDGIPRSSVYGTNTSKP
jgi:hypothetical protein